MIRRRSILVLMLIVHFPGIISPEKSNKTKYSSVVKGGYTADSFRDYRLPTSIVTCLTSASNLSLAMTTWASYRTAEAHVKRCESETGVRMRFPMDDRAAL
jgi:hypothetical protein